MVTSDDYRARIMQAATQGIAAQRKKLYPTEEFDKKPRKKRVEDPSNPTEYREQAMLCDWLKAQGIVYCHVPNGGSRGRIEGAMLKRVGVKSGVPDVLIFSVPAGGWTPSDALPLPRGVAVELKRRRGGFASESQQAWIDSLRACGWEARVCYGVDDAIAWLRTLGFGR